MASGSDVKVAPGDVIAMINVRMNFASDGAEIETRTWLDSGWRNGGEAAPFFEMQEIVKSELGNEFEIEEVSVQRGSVVLVLLICAVVSAARDGEDLVSQLRRVANRIRRLMSRAQGPALQAPTSTSVELTLGPAFVVRSSPAASPSMTSIPTIMVWLYGLSHLAILGLFIWLVIVR